MAKKKRRVYYSTDNLSDKPQKSRTRNKNGRIRKKRSDAKRQFGVQERRYTPTTSSFLLIWGIEDLLFKFNNIFAASLTFDILL